MFGNEQTGHESQVTLVSSGGNTGIFTYIAELALTQLYASVRK